MVKSFRSFLLANSFDIIVIASMPLMLKFNNCVHLTSGKARITLVVKCKYISVSKLFRFTIIKLRKLRPIRI